MSSFTVQATDSAGSQVSQALSITHRIERAALGDDHVADQCQPERALLGHVGGYRGDACILLGAHVGTLPAGLTLSSNGSSAECPPHSGTFPFTVSVSDSGAPAEGATATLT